MCQLILTISTDSHADDIIQIVREEFGEGNEFCRKITYSAENPEGVLSEFRNGYNPRIAVTVDMIATGTDVKPIECLIFMRDVRSKNYFEQMKGRGTRTLSKDDLQKVTPSATENKDHFVIVDAVGVTKSKKSETRPLERKPSVSLKELMMTVALGARDEDTLTSLANRVIRLNSQMNSSERKEFSQVVGVPANQLAEQLLNAFDEDILTAQAQEKFQTQEPTEEQMKTVQREAATQAAAPFCRPEVRDFIENVRRSHEQIIDNTNPDTLLFAGFDIQREENTDRVIRTFREFIKENKDEIIALRILYNQAYRDRPMAIEKLKVYRQAVLEESIPYDSFGAISQYIESMGQGWSPKCANKNSIDDDVWAVIKTTAVQHGYFDYTENKILPYNLEPRNQHEISVGDILITRAGPRSRCGVCCLVRKTKQRLLNCDKVYQIKPNRDKILPEYMEYVLNSPRFLLEINRCKTGGNDSGVNLTQSRFLTIKIPVPSVDIQKKIVEQIESRLSMCDSIECTIDTSLRQAEALRQSILKQAFEGRL